MSPVHHLTKSTGQKVTNFSAFTCGKSKDVVRSLSFLCRRCCCCCFFPSSILQLSLFTWVTHTDNNRWGEWWENGRKGGMERDGGYKDGKKSLIENLKRDYSRRGRGHGSHVRAAHPTSNPGGGRGPWSQVYLSIIHSILPDDDLCLSGDLSSSSVIRSTFLLLASLAAACQTSWSPSARIYWPKSESPYQRNWLWTERTWQDMFDPRSLTHGPTIGIHVWNVLNYNTNLPLITLKQGTDRRSGRDDGKATDSGGRAGICQPTNLDALSW